MRGEWDDQAARPGLGPVVERALALHQATWGEPARWVSAAPGRVNLIGEHVDYAGGPVLPMAIDRWCVAACGPSRRGGAVLRALSEATGERVEISLSRPLDAGEVRRALPAWAWYVAGVAECLRREAAHAGRGVSAGDAGVEMTVVSTVPLGAGVSSSAALEVSAGGALARAWGLEVSARGLARVGRRAEHEFAGVPCGFMDQVVSACATQGCALLIGGDGEPERAVPMPDDLAVVLVDSGVKHALPDGAYAARVRACQEAARVLGVGALAEASAAEVRAREGELSPEARRAAEHVTGEAGRVRAFAEVLEGLGGAAGGAGEAREWAMRRLGALVRESHESLRDLCGVSCPEVEGVVAACAQPGVWGCRLTGAGFGGCVMALVDRAWLDRAMGWIAEAASRRVPASRPPMEVRSVAGWSAWTLQRG